MNASAAIPVRSLGRRLVPRAIRNILRSPSSALRWIGAEAGYVFGRSGTYQLRSDWTMRCHPVSSHAVATFARDDDSVRELEGFIAHCTPDMQFIDVGASFGVMTLAALRFGGPGARVVAVEPGATSVRILKANLALAGESSRATVLQVAAGEENGTLEMLTTGAAGEHYLVASDAPRSDVKRVRQLTLDQIVREAGMIPTHVKIDVEGFEEQVIRGGVELLTRVRPIVFLELHSAMLRSRGRSPDRVLQVLCNMGYFKLLRHGEPISAAEACGLEIARLICLPERPA